MKRRDLVGRLEEAGCQLPRSSGPHDVYAHADGRKVSVPRHRELPEGLARAILRQAESTRRVRRMARTGGRMRRAREQASTEART